MGIAGSTAPGPTVGATVGVGTAGVALTPRLPISVEANGIPVRGTPPSTVGVVEVGVDDETTLLEPEPHIPDIPAVSIVPEGVETPDVPRMFDEFDIPDEALPAVIAVAGDPVPVPIPPPSKLAVDPNIDDGEVPTVEQFVPLAVLGIVIVPVTPVGAGLSPPEMISVDPSGIPVGPTGASGLTPSGDVAPRVGVVTIAPTCAMAPVEAKSAGSIARLSENANRILRVTPAAPRPECTSDSERFFAISIMTVSRFIRVAEPEIAIDGIDSGTVEGGRTAWVRSRR